MNDGSFTKGFMENILLGQEKTGLNDEQVAYLGGILVNNWETVFSEILNY